MCFADMFLYKDLMILSDLPLYFAFVIIGCACLWQYCGSRCRLHPFANQNIVIVNTLAESHLATTKLKESCEESRVLGFDCEWVRENKISLLQMSTSNGLCVLYRLCKLGDIPSDLKSLLEDSSYLKTGVGPVDDAKYLLKDYSVFVRGCIDLRHLVDDPDDARGLAKLTSRLLGVELEKGLHMRCSDWEAEELTPAQCEYAAQDALAAVKIFDKLIQRKLSHSVVGMFKYCLIPQSWDEVLNVCAMSIDIRYKDRRKNCNSGRNLSTKIKSGTDRLPAHLKTMRKQLYDNCWILAPDGTQLSTCTKKKAEWYINKQLGELVSDKDNPMCVRLLFEPVSRGTDERWRYNAQIKVNQCVVCASTEGLLRKNVVPLEYRRHFPSPMTDHSTHDILCLCLRCHLRSNTSDLSVRNRLKKMSFDGRPQTSNVAGETQWIKNPAAWKAKNAAIALTSGHVIPEDRVLHLQSFVKQYFNVSECTEEVIQSALSLTTSELNEEFKPHGIDVVEKFEAGPGLELLQKIWREHFMETMKPKYLPPLWSVNHGIGDADECEDT